LIPQEQQIVTDQDEELCPLVASTEGNQLVEFSGIHSPELEIRPLEADLTDLREEPVLDSSVDLRERSSPVISPVVQLEALRETSAREETSLGAMSESGIPSMKPPPDPPGIERISNYILDEEDDGMVDYVALSRMGDPIAGGEMFRNALEEKQLSNGKFETDSQPSATFWEESAQLDSTFRKPEIIPASPRNKKRNHARRDRRMGVQRRIADEKAKAEAKAERLSRRKARRERRCATQRSPRLPFAENPVRIRLNDGSGHWRLPRRSDVGQYVIRSVPGKIRRVWVQPTWVGKCSPRKHVKEENKSNVLRFLSCAMRIQPVDKSDFVRDFTENPYFERPQTLASGRVRPEVAQAWRVEDEIESSKGTGKWT
jgi:hypothetical protein